MIVLVYLMFDDVVEVMCEVAFDAGVVLLENLFGGVFVN